jgi:hypothetical protein
MIELTGLTPRQVELLDTIWNIDSVEECHEYIQNLEPHDQLDCQTLVRMIALELIDQAVNGMDQWKESRQVLDKYRLT